MDSQPGVRDLIQRVSGSVRLNDWNLIYPLHASFVEQNTCCKGCEVRAKTVWGCRSKKDGSHWSNYRHFVEGNCENE